MALGNALSGLQSSFQSASKSAQQAIGAGQQANLRQAIAGAAGPISTQQVQQMGGQARAAAGQVALSGAEQSQKQTAQVGGMQLQADAAAKQQALAAKQLALRSKRREMENKLAGMSEEIKTKILDNNLRFEQDEMGRTLWNDRQLLDRALRQSKDRNEFLAYQQQVQQLGQRKIQMLRQAHNVLVQKLESDAKSEIRELDQASREKMVRARIALQKKIADAQNEAANKAGMWSAGGTIVGAVAGGVLTGTPQGAAVGASAGGALGSAASTMGG